jgi:hypothetical protein
VQRKQKVHKLFKINNNLKRKERKQLIEIDPAAMQKFERNVNSVIEQIKS